MVPTHLITDSTLPSNTLKDSLISFPNPKAGIVSIVITASLLKKKYLGRKSPFNEK